MKVLSLKKTVIILLFTLIIIISMSVIITLKVSKTKIENNNYDGDIENIDIEIAEPDESICNDTKNKESDDEFLIEQYKNKKLVALTFDDGPSEYTSILVDELKKRNIPATFFVLGSEIEKYPDTLKFAYDAGNEIGIHSYKHTLFTKLSDEEINSQISKTKDLIFDITKSTPTLMRVPYGSTNKKIDKILSDNNLKEVLWTVDSLDWKFKNTLKTYNYVLKKFKGNDIILMHDSFKTSVNASTLIIDTLQSKCYTFVTVSKFFEIKEMIEKSY